MRPAQEQEKTEDVSQRRSFLMAVSSTPASFAKSQDIIDGFLKAKDAADVLLIQDPFNYVDFTSGKVSNSLRIQSEKDKKRLADATGLQIYYAMDTVKQRTALGTEVGTKFSNKAIRNAFKKGALFYLELYNPEFMALGIEVNYYYQSNQKDFANFVSLYKETYDEIKRVSPQTKVFVTFQYEALQGLQKGSSAHWEVVDKFGEKLDYIAISTHPYFPKGEIFSSPKQLPKNYFSRLNDKYNKPIIISETGWSSFTQINGSPQEQIEYLEFLVENARGLKMPLIVWLNLHDTDYKKLFESAGLPPSIGEGFAGIGLLTQDGQPKPVYSKWLEIKDLPTK